MGKLTSLWNSIAGVTEVEEAIIDAICATVLFDDEITDDELGYAIGFVEGMTDIDERKAASLVDAGFERVRGMDVDDVITHIVRRLPKREQRHVAFLASVGASHVGGGFFSWGEEDFLAALADEMGLTQDEMERLEKKADDLLEH